MKFNDKALIPVSHRAAQHEGRLDHRPPKESGYRERFFKLVGNLLFYFRFTDVGSVDTKEPAGVIVLENYSVQPEYEETNAAFSFSLLFLDEPDKKHVFCARTDVDVQKWVNALQKASYQHWREKLASMRNHINAIQEARSSPFLFQNGRLQNPRPNPFASPNIQRRLPPPPPPLEIPLPPSLVPPPPLPPRHRRNPSPNLVREPECEDLIQF